MVNKPPSLEDVPEAVAKAYLERISFFKKAKIYQQKEDIPRMVESVRKYLNSVAAFYGVEEKQLHPNLFKCYDHVSEQLLLSHAYWDLAKAYDRSEKLHDEAARCLKQFALFSIGFKYQYANSVMIKKYLRLRKANNVKAFEQCHDKIYVKAKGCFVSSFAYGQNHPVTSDFRYFRDHYLSKHILGLDFISFYYKHSPNIVSRIESFPFGFRFLTKQVVKIILYPLAVIAKVYRS
ncbi:MAG: hypothetical protein KC493_08810 [Bacteriovoracaceae bacterium]|nr:hypothetical protein [Bacteriovoracaceae bacterium]